MTTFNKNILNTDYIIGLPSGQIIDININDINALKREGLIIMNTCLQSYIFKDENYREIEQFLNRSKYVKFDKSYMNDLIEFFSNQKHVRSYKFSSDGGLDVSGSIFVTKFQGKKIPYKFKKVSGDFIFKESKIESLEGCPNEVGGNFIISGDYLFDLINGPKYVGKLYDCSNNCLETLEGAPKKIFTDFDCHDNFLIDLKGSPKTIIGTMDCSGNPLRSKKGEPQTCGKLITDLNKKISSFSDFGTKKLKDEGDGRWSW